MKNKELVLACDFETQNFLNEKEEVNSAVIAFACKEVFVQEKTRSIEIDNVTEINTKTFYFDSINLDQTAINNFFNYLFSFKDYAKVNIFFHNLKNFDGFFLVPYLLDNFEQHTLDIDLVDNTFKLLYVNNFLLNIKVQKDGVLYNFVDSLSFFPQTSLKGLGEIIGLSKLEFDEDFDIQEEKPQNSERYLKFIEYTKRDVEVLAKFLLFFVQKLKINLLNNISAAGISFSYFKQKYGKPGMFLSREDHWQIIQQSYYGGFTYLNPKYKLQVLDNLNYFDINSAYPYVLKNPLPYGDLQYFKNQKGGAKLFKILIKKLEVNDLDIPIIRSKKYNERFIKKFNGKLIYYIWDFEFEYVKNFYKTFEYKILNIYWFKLKKVADKFIDYWYKIKRQNSTKQQVDQNKNAWDIELKMLAEQKLMLYFSKVVLNSLYGKFGEKLTKPQRFYVKKEQLKGDPNQILLHNQLYHISTIHKTKNYKNFIEVTIIPENPKVGKIKNNAIASFVTAKVRVKLYQQILRHKDNFVYCDTDSIILKDTKLEKWHLSEEILGLWKIEHEGARGYFVKPKQYFLDSKNKTFFKTAGFQKLVSNLEFEKIQDTHLKFEKLSSKKSTYGVILKQQTSKLEVKTGKWEKVEK